MKHTDHTLCWHCRHAVPTKDKITGEYLTGCAWSIDRRPVEGWRTCQHRTYKSKIDIIREYGFPVLSKETAAKIELLAHPTDKNKTVRHAIITGETGEYGGFRKHTR